MTISTKGGDKGKTSLWSGQRVWKSDIRVESYGTIDELDAFIGDAKHYVKLSSVKTILEEVQETLMQLMGELASIDEAALDIISYEDVEKITQYVNTFEDKIKIKGFVAPGNTIQSSKLDICRTVARRAERLIVALSQIANINENLIMFVNRLSDLLFIMARAEELNDGGIKYKL